MAFLKRIGIRLLGAILRRLGMLLRVLIGGFMLLMGAWFTLAPITQRFFANLDILAQMPALWLIVPLGILQITVGISILRPLFSNNETQ